MMKVIFTTALLTLLFFSQSLFSQNVGIGTEDPKEKLHVSGNALIDSIAQARGLALRKNEQGQIFFELMPLDTNLKQSVVDSLNGLISSIRITPKEGKFDFIGSDLDNNPNGGAQFIFPPSISDDTFPTFHLYGPDGKGLKIGIDAVFEVPAVGIGDIDIIIDPEDKAINICETKELKVKLDNIMELLWELDSQIGVKQTVTDPVTGEAIEVAFSPNQCMEILKKVDSELEWRRKIDEAFDQFKNSFRGPNGEIIEQIFSPVECLEIFKKASGIVEMYREIDEANKQLKLGFKDLTDPMDPDEVLILVDPSEQSTSICNNKELKVKLDNIMELLWELDAQTGVKQTVTDPVTGEAIEVVFSPNQCMEIFKKVDSQIEWRRQIDEALNQLKNSFEGANGSTVEQIFSPAECKEIIKKSNGVIEMHRSIDELNRQIKLEFKDATNLNNEDEVLILVDPSEQSTSICNNKELKMKLDGIMEILWELDSQIGASHEYVTDPSTGEVMKTTTNPNAADKSIEYKGLERKTAFDDNNRNVTETKSDLNNSQFWFDEYDLDNKQKSSNGGGNLSRTTTFDEPFNAVVEEYFDQQNGGSQVGIAFIPANQQVDVFGNLHVGGTLSANNKNFKIDHPLDPKNKWLYHNSIESNDMMNIYNGNISTDEEGLATVQLPDYFEALNKDFKYQLTVIGSFSQAIIMKEIKNNTFQIATTEPNVKVSWQVTGVRNDTWARENRVINEVDKK